MRVRRFGDAAGFMAAAGAFLLREEALNNLPLGILSTFRTNPGHYPDPYFLAVEDGEAVVAAAIRTPPHNLILTETARPDALPWIADHAASTFGTLPGVIGPDHLTERFMALWQERTGQKGTVAVRERIYELTRVTWPKAPPGRLRRAEGADRPLLVNWFTAFHGETNTGMGPAETAARKGVERHLGDDTAGLWLWQDEEPVSLVGSAGPTGSGIRVGPVYTLPERRGRGYASWLTAAVSQLRLDEGYQRVFLFTDLANPTSNKIYQAIGYRPVGDAAQCQFSDPELKVTP